MFLLARMIMTTLLIEDYGYIYLENWKQRILGQRWKSGRQTTPRVKELNQSLRIFSKMHSEYEFKAM
jgi:hypothetical protein